MFFLKAAYFGPKDVAGREAPAKERSARKGAKRLA